MSVKMTHSTHSTTCPTILDLMIQPDKIIDDYNEQSKDRIKEILRSRGVNSHSAKTKKQLIDRLIKMHHQPVVYDGFTQKELAVFFEQRGLAPALHSTKEAQRRPRPDMVKVLEQADRDATFPLQDLPLELRHMVYKLALTASITLEKQAEPPLTRVSKVIRAECLPVYYRSNTFPIIVGIEKRKTIDAWKVVGSEPIPSNFWLLSLDAQSLLQIRNFEFTYSDIHHCNHGYNTTVFKLRVEFNPAKDSVIINSVRFDPWGEHDPHTLVLLNRDSIASSLQSYTIPTAKRFDLQECLLRNLFEMGMQLHGIAGDDYFP